METIKGFNFQLDYILRYALVFSTVEYLCLKIIAYRRQVFANIVSRFTNQSNTVISSPTFSVWIPSAFRTIWTATLRLIYSLKILSVSELPSLAALADAKNSSVP